MFTMPSALRLLFLSALTGTALGSRISFFSDDACQDFEYDVDGPNGYTDGQCSLLSAKGNFTSFKVVRLDRGCAGMWNTISSPFERRGLIRGQ